MIKSRDTAVSILSNCFVVVRKLKFDQIRQQSYWATAGKLCKQFKNREQAEAYCVRVLAQS